MRRSTNLLKIHFSKEEDDKLRSLVCIHGPNNWRVISKLMPGRNHRQCKDRWEKFLAPNIDHSPYSPEEDELIMKLFSQFGSKWTKISKQFKGRSDASLKSRYKVLMRRIIAQNKQTTTSEEESIDDILSKEPEIDSEFLFDFDEDDFSIFNTFTENE